MRDEVMSTQVEKQSIYPSAPIPHPLIGARAVSKIYRMGQTEVAALDRVSMSVAEGEFVAI